VSANLTAQDATAVKARPSKAGQTHSLRPASSAGKAAKRGGRVQDSTQEYDSSAFANPNLSVPQGSEGAEPASIVVSLSDLVLEDSIKNALMGQPSSGSHVEARPAQTDARIPPSSEAKGPYPADVEHSTHTKSNEDGEGDIESSMLNLNQRKPLSGKYRALVIAGVSLTVLAVGVVYYGEKDAPAEQKSSARRVEKKGTAVVAAKPPPTAATTPAAKVAPANAHLNAPTESLPASDGAYQEVIESAYQYLERGSETRAARHFREALRLKSDGSEAHAGLGQVALKARDYREAVTNFKKATELGDKEAFFGLGMAYHKLSKDSDARSAFEEYLRVAPFGEKVDEAKAQLERLDRDKSPSK